MNSKDMPKAWQAQAFKRLPPAEQVRAMQEGYKAMQSRLSELEQRIEHLRISRRTLMALLEKAEREKNAEVSRLEKLLALERRKKYMVHKNHPLWKSHVLTFKDFAEEYVSSLSDSTGIEEAVKKEAEGIRENAQSIRDAVHAEAEEEELAKATEARKPKHRSSCRK